MKRTALLAVALALAAIPAGAGKMTGLFARSPRVDALHYEIDAGVAVFCDSAGQPLLFELTRKQMRKAAKVGKKGLERGRPYILTLREAELTGWKPNGKHKMLALADCRAGEPTSLLPVVLAEEEALEIEPPDCPPSQCPDAYERIGAACALIDVANRQILHVAEDLEDNAVNIALAATEEASRVCRGTEE